MLQICGPGVLSGIRLGDWLRLLREHRRDIDVSRLPRVFAITLQSVKNSGMGIIERHRFAEALQKVVIQPPIFILGHWRSGTTHLHQIMCQDDRFAFPNSYQTAFPVLPKNSADVENWCVTRPPDSNSLTSRQVPSGIGYGPLWAGTLVVL